MCAYSFLFYLKTKWLLFFIIVLMFEQQFMFRFLAGKDAGFFDYSMVDEDERAEEMDEIAERDREEAWFDED